MKIHRGFKVELDLNNRQRTACIKSAGAARFAWNWGLAEKMEAYKQTGKMPTAIDLSKRLVILKKAELAWLYESTKCAPQESLRDLDVAYKRAFRRLREKRKKTGWPRFKSRKSGIGSFRLAANNIRIKYNAIQLPKLGVLRLKEHGYLPVGAIVAMATVSEKAGRWYVSVQTEREAPDVTLGSGPSIGIDLGIKALATCSDGSQYTNPRVLHASLVRLRRYDRQLSRKAKGSQNRKKARNRLAKLHARIARIRHETLHQTTTAIVTKAKSQQARCLVIEDLNVSGMRTNRRLSRAILDTGMTNFRYQLAYKAEAVGMQIEVVSCWYPSSRTCSSCGWVDSSLTLADRTFQCQQCNLVLDRDLNAARNLANSTASYAGYKPMEIDALASRQREVKRRSVKQEPNTDAALVAIG